MTNQQIAQLLKNVAAAYTIQNANRFKILAYDKAADSIEHLTHEVKDIWNQGKLNQIPGIGPSIASHLDELFRTGQVKHFDSVMGKIPKSIYPLLELTGFGPKKAAKLVTTLKLEKSSSIIDDLTKAANLGKIAQIEGFGEKSQEDILESINAYKKGRSKQKRMPLPYAYALAEEVVSYLRRSKDVLKVTPLGSLRRMVSTIGDIDLAVSTNNPQKVVDYFLSYPQKGEIVEKGPEGATILLVNGQQIDMRVIKPKAWGSMLQYFTGSKYHNIKLREFALKPEYQLQA
ncbi:DNA polymerase III, partial [Candidatus Gottesmanbacteria bacterium]|nr:DNA polymerase III [Candidatus Gottesmanbacteria bacterium]